MAKTKAQKLEILKGLKEKFSEMKSVIFVNFSGLPVKEINNLRNSCKEKNVNYIVAKKTLLKKVLAEKGLVGIGDNDFKGEVAAVIGFEDEVAPAKLVSDFAKDHEKLEIIAGWLDGLLVDKSRIQALAKLPSKSELLAKAVGSIAAPLSGLVNVLQGNIRGLVYTFKAMSEKK
ncbi:MAG: 50S ribosomal protein L10 [Candidatus Buchananbacteria bacterium RIFCSPLOWO2_01_FULL_39_33]|uniref:Large ribosomal subunit protein uL10 n=1 Tax=Candidatus Buchananbacteria bacterium RIFCSPLOWO2_01_FULL_39_33 TaxID=1797543 RepID=A0A1G1YGS7_9BACT|nr:MAG: 50S ribosomal protein L10 [Candidatus Buchananbacteria bacterium RIFCSPHIGHO2_01_FULL_40_35]OGY51542.1 MAG: 50S ribosomal protein L10 [Candidatus Buchananbacteria bacterium RIFCSPLOWO2_01_FULL_39_33]